MSRPVNSRELVVWNQYLDSQKLSICQNAKYIKTREGQESLMIAVIIAAIATLACIIYAYVAVFKSPVLTLQKKVSIAMVMTVGSLIIMGGWAAIFFCIGMGAGGRESYKLLQKKRALSQQAIEAFLKENSAEKSCQSALQVIGYQKDETRAVNSLWSNYIFFELLHIYKEEISKSHVIVLRLLNPTDAAAMETLLNTWNKNNGNTSYL